MEYLVEGTKFNLSYSELKEHYIIHCEMTDDEFMNSLSSALHTACVICYLKEIPTYLCLSDMGIIHELIHLLHIPQDTSLKKVRELFKQQLKLV